MRIISKWLILVEAWVKIDIPIDSEIFLVKDGL